MEGWSVVSKPMVVKYGFVWGIHCVSRLPSFVSLQILFPIEYVFPFAFVASIQQKVSMAKSKVCRESLDFNRSCKDKLVLEYLTRLVRYMPIFSKKVEIREANSWILELSFTIWVRKVLKIPAIAISCEHRVLQFMAIILL